MKIGEILAEQIDGGRVWTLKLIADFRDGDWGYQPAPGLAHPLWTCGHLACAQHLLIFDRCLGKPFLDASFAANFPIGAAIRSFDEHAYPKPAEVLETMKTVHERTLAALRGIDERLLEEPAFGAGGQPHPHYHNKLGVIAHCHRHEAFHAGQLAMIRRLLGRTFLR